MHCCAKVENGMNIPLDQYGYSADCKAIACRATGQAHDLRETETLVRDLSAGHLLADRAFDADWLRNDLLERGIIPVIPPKSNRKFPATFDKETYKWRHLIENYFGKLKENRGIAMRSCKTDQSFKAFISIAATIIQIR